MGWCSGSDVYEKIIPAAKKAIPNKAKRVEFHKAVIDAFEDHDWDCQEDVVGNDPAFDEALYALHPDWLEDDEDDPL